MAEGQTSHLLTCILSKPYDSFQLFEATIFNSFQTSFSRVVKTHHFTAPLGGEKRVLDLEVEFVRVADIYIRLKPV